MDVLLIIVFSLATLGFVQLTIWVIKCTFYQWKPSSVCKQKGAEGYDVMSSEMKMLQKTVLDLTKHLETARIQATKDIAGKQSCGGAQKDIFKEIYMAAGKRSPCKFHLNKSCPGLNNAGGIVSFHICAFCASSFS